MANLTTQIIAYTAGLFDGEGHIEIPTGKTYPGSLQVSIAQKRPEVLHMVAEWFGGKVYGPYANECYHWQITKRDDSVRFLEITRPFLIVKSTEAWLALEYAALWEPGGRWVAEESRDRQRALRDGFRLASLWARKAGTA